jgi:hypothetical protein
MPQIDIRIHSFSFAKITGKGVLRDVIHKSIKGVHQTFMLSLLTYLLMLDYLKIE